jgi:hypothetical protein
MARLSILIALTVLVLASIACGDSAAPTPPPTAQSPETVYRNWLVASVFPFTTLTEKELGAVSACSGSADALSCLCATQITEWSALRNDVHQRAAPAHWVTFHTSLDTVLTEWQGFHDSLSSYCVTHDPPTLTRTSALSQQLSKDLTQMATEFELASKP